MKTNILVVCLLTYFLSSSFIYAQNLEDDSEDLFVYRLPDNTEPVSYDLRMKPIVDLKNDNYTFIGQVDIVIRVIRYTTEVTLNSKNLNISSVSRFRDLKTKRYTAVKEYYHEEKTDQMVIRLSKSIVPPRLYNFTINFEGTLNNNFMGLHRYFYDSNDKSRWTVMTQFKPIYARTAFPCYDEPKFKTAYNISIARKCHHIALSNMPLKISEIDPQTGWVWDYFETTKPIPTYLVAFMVSDFNRKTLDNENNIAVYTRKEFIDDTTYITKKVQDLLNGVEQFTQIPYMLPKLDLVGIPLLDAYNMENWGLNSYKESYLTLTKNSEIEEKMLVLRTVLNTILHQWFGNMVTTPWWDSTWLNEGICNYLNYYILDTIEPDWNLKKMFVENVHQYALYWDEYDDMHPLTYPVETSNDIVNIFDPIMSDKSAALFRMLECIVGKEYFKKSLTKYLNDYAYTASGPKELWKTFDYVLFDEDYVIDDDVIVTDLMYLWTEQAGYPLINIENDDNGSVVITQNRFSLSYPPKMDNIKWFVGLTYTTEKLKNFNKVTPTVWLKPDDDQKTIPVPKNSGWIIFNIQSTGFYRVNYDQKNWKLILLQLIIMPCKIHELNRAQIIDDVYHLAKAGLLPYYYYISLLEYLLMEDHVTPWNVATKGLSSIMNSIRQYPLEYMKFKKYANKLADILYKKLSNNQINNKLTKDGWSKLLSWTCKLDDMRCKHLALRYFNTWMNGYDIPPEMEEMAFCMGIKKGSLPVWSKMLEFYKKTRKTVALRAMACVENDGFMVNYLKMILQFLGQSRTGVGNFKTICESLTTTPRGVKTLVNFLSVEVNAILKLNEGSQLVAIAYSTLASKVATSNEITTMRRISQSVESADLRTMFDEKLKIIESNFNWMKRDYKKIVDAIGNN